ncbi:Y-family DNA polymerase [Arcicella sp. LKC2W]|uniref:Y-family DNA polymerase n=1 Tax=Arcicella sp. LKC2W TaxID=2984198 RepID=UPI002B1F7349|nr:Y-family DNA polymerase [Arcicella sp. LKC2W]MEA5459751.1 Y-family DNA polymerase [Arcicella sp. LKC2W]
MNKWFGLADCNNFYVSCERIFSLSARDIPVVVLSNNDGCVISRSQEAKDMGIEMGVPLHKISDYIHKKQLEYFSSNYALYGDISSRVMNCLNDLCPAVEVYSIDEAFLDLSIIPDEELYDFGVEVKHKIGKWTKIPVSIGIAPTKSLAKVANRYAKKYHKIEGVFVIDSKEVLEKVLTETPIESVWGIGRKHGKFLKNHNVNTALEFTKLPENFIRKHFSIVGLRLYRELKGESCLSLTEVTDKKKAIQYTRSFGRYVNTLQDLEEALTTFASKCAEKLRSQQSCTNAVSIYIRTNPFNKKAQFYNSITLNFDIPTNSTMEIQQKVIWGLKQIFVQGYDYKKAGVCVTGLVPNDAIQGNLFRQEADGKSQKISKLMDLVNAKFGKDTITFAVQGSKSNWQGNAGKISPRYTTFWKDIPKVE